MSDNRLKFALDTIQDFASLGRNIELAKLHLKKGGFDDSLIEAASREFGSRLANNLGAVILKDRSVAVANWYGVPSSSPGSHWQLLKEELTNRRNWTEEMLQSLDLESTTVVSNLSPPSGETKHISKGLVLGYVQSGKTTNFSAVIAKALDSGYRLVIVLAGIHNNLRFQTERRLYREICAPQLSSCTNLTAVDENGDFKRTQTQKAERACGGRDGFSLAVLKKNATVLRNFETWLSEAKPETLKNCPTLIIDDESDHASVNTAKPEEDPTAINNLIRKIISRFGTVSYVGYTATPFANVLIDSSIEDELYPRDFLISLEKPVSYFGAEELFGSQAILDTGEKKGLAVIRTIPADETVGLTGSRRIEVRNISDGGIPQSLKDAFYSFILAGSIRIARQQHGEHMTMLVHTSHLTSIQGTLFESFREFIDALKVECGRSLSDELAAVLTGLYETDFKLVSSKFKDVRIWPRETILKNASHFIAKLELILDNSASEERLSFDRQSPLWAIVIGGNTLSRGLTIEGLTTSYYIREAKGYDTLLQMGRWFGYRPNYVDLTRIYMTESLQKKFFNLSCVEAEIRNEIKTLAENKERPIDVALRIRCLPAMAVTSNLKMQSAKTTSMTFSGTKLQARHIVVKDDKILRHNLESVFKLLENIEKSKSPVRPSRFDDFSGCLVCREVSPELILQFLDTHIFSEANVRFSSKLLSQYIQDMMQKGELGSWTVAVMGSKNGNPITLPNGRRANRVERSIIASGLSERDDEAVYLSALSPPDDELIDLDDTVSLEVKSVLAFRTHKNGTRLSASALRLANRPNSRGLLMLYPLEVSGAPITYQSKAASRDIEPLPISGKLTPLKANIDIFGVTLVFPKTKNESGAYQYIINGTV